MSKLLAALAVIFLVAVVLAVSWFITVFLIHLVCYLFGYTFNIAIATGIWLILIIAKSVFSNWNKE